MWFYFFRSAPKKYGRLHFCLDSSESAGSVLQLSVLKPLWSLVTASLVALVSVGHSFSLPCLSRRIAGLCAAAFPLCRILHLTAKDEVNKVRDTC